MDPRAQNEQDQKLAQVVARALQDPAYRARLMADPLATVREAGVPVNDGVTVYVHENGPTALHVVIPVAPAGGVQAFDAPAPAVTAITA